MKNGRKLIGDLIATLDQGVTLIRTLSDEQYTHSLTEPSASSLGAHYRHHLDHVRSLVVGLDGGVIDYDDRVRGSDIEFDRAIAVRASQELLERLRGLGDGELALPLTVVQRSCCEGEDRPESPTTVMRELAFLQSHAVHHFAVMALIARLQGIQPPPEFGVMPSTLNYEASLNA